MRGLGSRLFHACRDEEATYVGCGTYHVCKHTYVRKLTSSIILAVKSSKIDMIVTKMIRWTNGTHVRRRPVHVTVAGGHGTLSSIVIMNTFSIPRAIIIFARRVRFGLEAY